MTLRMPTTGHILFFAYMVVYISIWLEFRDPIGTSLLIFILKTTPNRAVIIYTGNSVLMKERCKHLCWNSDTL